MCNIVFVSNALVIASLFATAALAQPDRAVVQFDADELEDKIRGGLLAQVIGNLNGLLHEMKYIDEPGQVEHYTPSLPDGAWTDDDTDLEWVYLHEIVRSRECLLPPDRIAALWKRHINRRIWCANRYARDLMDLGIEPPWTGNVAINPWSDFNISGQFICESFGLMAPAMPQTAAKVGLRYTRVTIDGEPAQTTQLFTAMIAMAFIENDIEKLLDAGLDAIDSESEIAQIVREVRQMYAANPDDWQKTRRQIRDRWQKHGGEMRDRNGYELNTASTIAALLYGRKDFVETLRLAFNFGWDCDNNAATAGTIVGVMRGRRWMNAQGWNIADVYRNTSRDAMPEGETLTSFGNTLIQCAQLAIEGQGGKVVAEDGRRVYRIQSEQPANVEPFSTADDQVDRAHGFFTPHLEQDLTRDGAARARAAYLAICLGKAEQLSQKDAGAWKAAVAELQKHRGVVRNLFTAPDPSGDQLRTAAKRAGLRDPGGK